MRRVGILHTRPVGHRLTSYFAIETQNHCAVTAGGQLARKNGVRFGTYGETRTLVKRARFTYKYRVLES